MKDYENNQNIGGGKAGTEKDDLDKKNRQDQDKQGFDKKHNQDPAKQAPNRDDQQR